MASSEPARGADESQKADDDLRTNGSRLSSRTREPDLRAFSPRSLCRRTGYPKADPTWMARRYASFFFLSRGNLRRSWNSKIGPSTDCEAGVAGGTWRGMAG